MAFLSKQFMSFFLIFFFLLFLSTHARTFQNFYKQQKQEEPPHGFGNNYPSKSTPPSPSPPGFPSNYNPTEYTTSAILNAQNQHDDQANSKDKTVAETYEESTKYDPYGKGNQVNGEDQQYYGHNNHQNTYEQQQYSKRSQNTINEDELDEDELDEDELDEDVAKYNTNEEEKDDESPENSRYHAEFKKSQSQYYNPNTYHNDEPKYKFYHHDNSQDKSSKYQEYEKSKTYNKYESEQQNDLPQAYGGKPYTHTRKENNHFDTTEDDELNAMLDSESSHEAPPTTQTQYDKYGRPEGMSDNRWNKASKYYDTKNEEFAHPENYQTSHAGDLSKYAQYYGTQEENNHP